MQNRAGNGHWFKSLALTTFMAFFVADDNNARFASQRSDSTQVSLGMQVSRAISLSYGVLVPQMDMAMTRELNDESSSIDASLVGGPNVRI